MPIIKVDDVAYPTLQVPDLDLQEKFLINFGLHRLERTENKLYMHGEGSQQYVHVSQKGDAKFLSIAFKAKTRDDLEKLSKAEGFSDVEKIDAPGGGECVWGTDPDGIKVEVVFGIKEKEQNSELKSWKVNTGGELHESFGRVNIAKRFKKGAYPRVKRFAHLGLNVTDVGASFDWYHNHIGIIISDDLRLPPDYKMRLGIFARLDRGKELADHHSIFFIPAPMRSNGVTGLNHVSYEMVDIDDVFMGHEILKKEGYNLEWGIGRHYQGSQIFDYWRSPFDQVHEHETDGDVFDNTVPPNIVEVDKDGNPTEPEMGPSQWGPAVTPTFANDKGT